MRTPVIAGNWKLFKTADEAATLVSGLIPLVKDTTGVEIVIAPVFTVLDRVSKLTAGTPVKLSAQDCFWEEEGAFTGEISPKMLRDAGCSHVIIGHSERRQYFGETDETVNKKTKAAIAAGLTAIVCVGETLKEREDGIMNDVLKRQVTKGLEGLSSFQAIIVAYEPVWAIGTGKTASDEQAQDAHKYIRQVIKETFGSAPAESTRILYGGSVKPENVKGLMTQPDIDGALVGGASLKADSFGAIVNFGK
ncbi:triose-phosphate isomerase [Geobacter pelophilus]|uniref:Triosephosphate isomerase n=1 Tax=Geoanaerobacter pelophilus TaxID=60036 RepID=A0AAW4KZW6_9BACT|nr:triose-phosphate isomerase [Geoanaerobacter pelophilus]MBT0664339.1 triose-phosphate isomerase [Geoanaerobacter pelophilus]